MDTPSPPLLVTVEGAAQMLALSRTGTYALIGSGVLLSVKVGGRRRVRVADIAVFVAGLST